MQKILYILTVFLCLTGAVLWGWYQVNSTKTASKPVGELVMPDVPIGGDFTLSDQHGTERTLKEFEGKLLLIYFGYTYCPDFCPTELHNLSDALKLLGQRVNQVQPLFISVDPERDTQELLKTYMEHYHPAFLALRGTKEQTDMIMKDYRVYANKVMDESASDYVLDHTTFVYLLGRDGKIITMFHFGTPATQIAKTIKAHL